MMSFTSITSTGLLKLLAESGVRSLLLGGAVGLGMFAVRVKATSFRLFTWTAVLYAALAMPLLGWMLPPLPIPTPAFLRSALTPTASVQSHNSRPSQVLSAPQSFSAGGNVAGKGRSSAKIAGQEPSHASPLSGRRQSVDAVTPRASLSPSIAWTSISWSAFAAGIYFVVVLLLLARLLVGLIFARRLSRSSQRIPETRVSERIASFAHACGLGRIPLAFESEVISVPATVGILRPRILLPGGWREWDDAKFDAVIAHEVSHVARRDALTQRISLLHCAIFWFSPLAWWLDRHLADLAEQASDEAALRSGADRTDYARILLGFFETLQVAPGRVWWQGVSMAEAGQAERRMERILAWKEAGGNIAMSLKKSAVVMTFALVIPAVYVAASAHPISHQFSIAQNAAPPATQPLAPAAEIAPTATQAPIAMPTAALAPAEATPASGFTGHVSSYSYAYGDDDESRFVIVTGNSDSVTMSGNTEDAHHAQRLRKEIPGDFIWFERDEKSYIIRDPAMIARARKLWAPQEELSKKQEALGKQQSELGKQQAALGEKQRQVQVKVPDMTAEVDKLKAELKQLGAGATQEQIGQVQSEVGELQSKIGTLQSQAGEQQSKLGEQQSKLGEQQSKLGEQQSELGRQQSELSEQASRQMRDLLDESIKNGTAKPEAETGASL